MWIKWPGPRLPAELTDEIIAWVRLLSPYPFQYYPTLLDCCLVCSQWLPASRHQLFQHIYIPRSQNYDLFVSRVLSQSSMRIYLSHVRTLDLAAFFEESSRPSSIPFAYAFVGHLPKLTSLWLAKGGVKKYLCRHPCTPLALSRFSSIQELRIDHNEFPSWGDVRRVLTSLPNLTVLSMDSDVRWSEPAVELSPLLASPSSRPRLVALSYTWDHDCSAGDTRRAIQLLTWLASTSTGSSLRRLTLDLHLSKVTYADVCGAAFMYTVACCVEELSLKISSDIACTPTFLERFVKLEVLHIAFDVHLTSIHGFKISRALPCLLPLLPTPSRLRQLRFYLTVNPIRTETHAFDWVADLDAALEHEHFHALTEVAFCVTTAFLNKEDKVAFMSKEDKFMSKEQIRELIEGKLPKLCSCRPTVLRIHLH